MDNELINPAFQGVNTHRYVNPYELKYAKVWQDFNSIYEHPILAYLMNGADPATAALSERDWLVANTVIQWLGSPVGFQFIAEVLGFQLPNLDEYMSNVDGRGR